MKMKTTAKPLNSATSTLQVILNRRCWDFMLLTVVIMFRRFLLKGRQPPERWLKMKLSFIRGCQ